MNRQLKSKEPDSGLDFDLGIFWYVLTPNREEKKLYHCPILLLALKTPLDWSMTLVSSYTVTTCKKLFRTLFGNILTDLLV